MSLTGRPSTTKSGLLPLMVEMPRTRIWGVAPGSEPAPSTVTPAALPCKAEPTSLTVSLASSAPCTVVTALVTVRFSCEPKPITTASSSC